MNLEIQSAAQEIATTRAFTLTRVDGDTTAAACLQLAVHFPCTPEQNPHGFDIPELPGVEHIDASEFPVIQLQHFTGAGLASLLAGTQPGNQFSFAVLRSLAHALDTLHAAGRVHAALSPWSILVTEDAQTRIVDWMIPWQTLPFGERAHAAEYLAPEVLASATPDARADQFALGAIACRLLVGQSPFPGASLAEILFRIRFGMPDRDITGQLHVAQQMILDRVLSVDPTERFESCQAFVEQLEQTARLRHNNATRLEYSEADRGDQPPATDTEDAEPESLAESPVQQSVRGWWAIAVVLSFLAIGLGVTDWFLGARVGRLADEGTPAGPVHSSEVLANGTLRVCNASSEPLTVNELAAAYWSREQRLRVFSSPSFTHSGWVVAPASSQALSWPSGESSVWDGSVLFYFLRVQKGNREYIVTGRWDAEGEGCLHL